MSVELVFKARRHDQNGEAGETRSTFNSVEEALLQAAHNEMVTPSINVRIEVDGQRVAGPADFKKALKVYREARNLSLSINDQGVVEWDTSQHAAAMKGLVG